MKLSRRWLLALLAVVLLAGAAVPVVLAWRNRVVRAQHARALRAVEAMVSRGDLVTARAALQGFLKQAGASLDPADQSAWVDLDVRVSARLRDPGRLLFLFERHRAQFESQEDAALLVLRALRVMGERDGADALREKWRGREGQPHLWLVLDADELIREGKGAEAVALLEGRTFAGAADCGRLLRLALLKVKESGKAAEYLARAYAADPKNADVRSFRGQVLERAGQLELARVEYVAALVADPRDAMRRDQLAAFYVRTASFLPALKTYEDGLAEGAPDFLWLQSLFWQRMVRPGKAPAAAPPGGRMLPLIELLRAQPAGSFWPAGQANAVRGVDRFLAQWQELAWLRIWQAVKDGQEAEAAELLAADRFRAVSFSRELASALKIVLQYRATGRTPASGEFSRNPYVSSRHLLFEQIERWSGGAAGGGRELPEELQRFLRGKHAFAGLALAAGWPEAALQLAELDGDLAKEPDWLRFGLAQALRFNRSPEEALAFLRRQPTSPALEVLRGEILLGQKDFNGARAHLEPLAAQPSDAGYRAAWLLATHALDTGDSGRAEALVRAQPGLRDQVSGREILARCALRRGDNVTARKLYAGLGADSLEAMTFLAREAFAAADWPTARKWTELLLARLPDELQLRANLAQIAAAEAKAGATRR